MKSAWRKHLTICLALGLLAVPVYFLDLAATGAGGGSNWITLDFRGLIFWTYITLLAIHVSLSSVAVPLFPNRKSTRLNSSHGYISYAVFCLKKKNRRLRYP